MPDDEKVVDFSNELPRRCKRPKSTSTAARKEEAAAFDPSKQEIHIKGGGLKSEAEAAEKVLARAGITYRRENLLVRVVREENEPDPKSRLLIQKGSPVIVPLDPAAARALGTELANWMRFDRRLQEWVRANMTKDAAQSLIALSGYWNTTPKLLGIVEAPTLRPDGSVLDQPGYDPASGLLLDMSQFDAANFTLVTEPTKSAAEQSLTVLLHLIKDFPFIDEVARSAALAMLMTPVVRRSLPTAPMFLVDATRPVVGKTLLAECASLIATGRSPAAMTQATNAEEEAKAILAALIGGQGITLIDNIDRPLRSAQLCAALTLPTFQGRVLGLSKLAEAPTNVTWIGTGNNVSVEGDLTSRIVTSRLVPTDQFPEQRQFNLDLRRYIPARRYQLVAAILTIIRAYMAAGCPRETSWPRFGRFEEWQQWVRFPLLWLGRTDPLESLRVAQTRDPVREDLLALLSAWRELFGDEAVTVDYAIRICAEHAPEDRDLIATYPDDGRRNLRDAMRPMAGEKSDQINPTRLGKYIARYEQRIENGLHFKRAGTVQNRTRWLVSAI